MTNTPSDAEIEKLAAEHLKAFSQFPMGGQVWFEGEVEFARAVLAKWGTQPQAGAVPQRWKAVPVNPTPEMWKAAKTVPDPNPPYPPHYGLVWDAMLAASPTPPVEQQATSSAVLKAIRAANMQLVRTGDDAFMLVPYKVATTEAAAPKAGVTTGAALGGVYAELPAPLLIQYDEIDCEEFGCFAEEQMRDFADRTHALRMQAAPKAVPTRTALPEGWTDCTIEFGNDGPEVVAYGPTRMMTRLAKWLGKYFAQVIAEAAPKAAPVELSADSLRHQNKLLAETLGACILASGIVRKDIDGFTGPELLHFGEDLRSMLEAAPQQEAQEPVAYVHVPHSTVEGKVRPVVSFEKYQQDYADGIYSTRIPLYAAPQPAPDCHHRPPCDECRIAAQGGKA